MLYASWIGIHKPLTSFSVFFKLRAEISTAMVFVARSVRACIAIVIGLNIACLLAQSTASFVNDDYCDFLDGGDENATSACSHLPGTTFRCKTVNAWSAATITTSRLNDGVCDCCDGSDETSSYWPSCPNKCEAQLQDQKKSALAMHRNIQAGMRARAELVEAFKVSRNKDAKQIESMKAEHDTLDKMVFKMMYFLQREEAREVQLRFALLREREHRCAEGHLESCEYFHHGYFDEDELLYEGYPLEYAKKAQRFHWVHSEAEIEHLQRLTGYERAKQSICTVKDLLPDDDARIFTKVGEYLSFMESPGGRISRAVTPRQRKLNTLFGRFLENGDKGMRQGQLLVLEVLGLLLAPVTMIMRGMGYASARITQETWHAVERCAYPSIAADLSNTNSTRVPLTERPEIQQGLRALGAVVPTSPQQLCQLILATDVEGSTMANAASVLDYTAYSPIMTFLDVWGEYLVTPSYMWEVIYRSPVLYWEYYVLGRSAELPPRRQSCLLRAGLEAAREEMKRLTQRIQATETLIRETASQRYITIPSEDDNGDDIVGGPRRRGGSRRSRGRRAKDQSAEKKVPLDFGPEGYWESVLHTCLETSAGQHEYKFCYFGEVWQDGVRSLGRFAHWGNESLAVASAAHSENRWESAVATVDMDGAVVTGDSGVSGGGGEGTGSGPSDRDILFEDRTALSASDLTEEILNDLSEHPYVAPLLAAWLNVTTFVSARVAEFAEYMRWQNRLVGLTPAGERALSTLSTALTSTYITLISGGKGGKTQNSPVTSGFSGIFGASAGGKVGFQGTPAEVQAHYSVQTYRGGERCFPGHGAPRRTEVHFECGMNAAITEVVEVESCVYRMVVSTPLVCTPYLETTSLERLDQLGVFGYSSHNSGGSGGGGGGGDRNARSPSRRNNHGQNKSGR